MHKSLLCSALAALTLASPAVAAEEGAAPICTDRPAKANAVCTVPAGKWQLESSVLGWARTEADGAETEVLTLGPRC
jgi:hypothetical protein